MPVVTVSEIYDLNTVKDKMGIIGVHTPTRESIDKKWHGLFLNHKFFRILDCDIQISCASVLPLDPLGIGTETGKVAPQDVMNPILFRAVSNEAWNAIVGRLYSTAVGLSEIEVNSARVLPDGFPQIESQEALYYQLLSSQEWRKALPQAGLNMSGLKPLCWPVVSTTAIISQSLANASPQSVTISSSQTGEPQSENASSAPNGQNSARFFRGSAQPLPRFPTCPRGIQRLAADGGMIVDDYYVDLTSPAIQLPRIYCACIVMPPMKLNAMYFRMKISWRISFDDPVSILEQRWANQALADTPYYYKRSYDFTENPSKSLDSVDGSAIDTTTIDTLGFEPNLIMET